MLKKIGLVDILRKYANFLGWIDKLETIKSDRNSYEVHETLKSYVSLGQSIFNNICEGTGIKIVVSIENEDERFNRVRQKSVRFNGNVKEV